MKIPKNSSRSTLRGRLSIKSTSLAALLLVSTGTVFAQTQWIGGTGDFNNPASWNGTYIGGSNPNCSNDTGTNNFVLIQPGDPIWQHGDTLAGNGVNTSGSYLQTGSTNNTGGPNWLRMGLAAGSYGQYILSNGVVNVGGRTQLGENGTGYLEIDGGVYNGNVNDGTANPAMVCGQGDFGSGTGTLVINGGTVNMPRETWIGQSTGTGYFFMNGGTYNANDWVAIGRAGAPGVLNMTNGTINKTGNGEFLIGTGGTGYMNQTGGVLTTTSRLRIGDGSTGVYNLAKGSANVGGEFWIGQSGTGNGTLNLSGNAAVTNNDWLAVGREGAQGMLNLSGGTMVKAGGGNISICHGAGASGTVNQTAGTFICASGENWIGEDSGPGIWTISGGTATFGLVSLCQNSSASGTVNLNGGVFTATQIVTRNSGGTSTFNFNGGTLVAGSSANANFMAGLSAAYVQAGGAVIDSGINNITISQALLDSGGGGLTKNGTGTLTLSGANGYSGATLVNAGTLATTTASTGGGGYSVANGATLNVQVVGSLDSQLNMSSLSFASTATTLGIDLNSFGNPTNFAPINVSGALTINGTVTINITDGLPQVGQFPLIAYGSKTGSGYVLGTLPTGVTAHLVDNTANHSIDLDITVVNLPRWDGKAGGNWDIGLTTNWINLGTGLPTYYQQGNAVAFDDNATGTTTVNLITTVNPSSVTVNDSALSYTFTGSGKISGSTGLTKEGTGTLTIANTGGNNYTGPTIISGGVVSVTSLANGGSPSAIGASSANPTNLVLANAALSYSGTPVAVNRGFAVASTNSTIDAESNLTFSGLVTALPNPGIGSGFVKTGPAQLALTTVGINQFANNFNPGAQVQQGTLLLDGSAGGQTNHTVNDMYVGDTPTSGGALILSNTTLNVDGWLGAGRINGSINNTSSITLYNSTVNSGNLTVGWDGGQPGNLSSQFLTLNGSSTLADHGDMNLSEGTGSSATININGTALLSSQNRCFVALASSSTGAVTIANSGHMSVGAWYSIGAGQNSLGSTLVKDNGSLNVTGDLNICDGGSGATGSLTVQDNATATGRTIQVGKGPSCSGTLTISGAGASVSANGAYMTSAAGNDATTATITIGSATQPGGSLNGWDDFTLGQDGTAVLNMVANGGGTLTVPSTMYLSRGSGLAHGIVNLNVGSTIVAGYVNNGWGFQNNLPPTGNPNDFNFNGGTLKSYGGANPAFPFIQPFVNVVVQAGGAVIDDNGAVRYISAPLVDGGGGGGLTKLGAGALALLGANTYTGATLVSAGTLAVGPGGVIAGPVKVASGATLAGDTGSIESFNINNMLTLSNGCHVLMQITPASNDQITGLTGVSYGGSLVVSNSSATTLTVGSVFKLFNSASPGTGNFSSVTLLPVGSATFNPATGELTITSVTPFQFNAPSASGGNLILTGGGGSPGAHYTLLTSTNVTLPVASWTTNTSGTLDGSGAFSNAIPINHSEPKRFFGARMP